MLVSGFIPQSEATIPQDTISYKNNIGKVLVEKGNEPVINIILFNDSQASSFMLVSFMTHIETFQLHKSNESVTLLANYTFGINLTSYIWTVRLDQTNNFIVSLANGTIFSFDFNGHVNWVKPFSTKAISDLRILQNGQAVAISDAGQIIWFNPTNGNVIQEFTINNTYFTVSAVFNNYFVTGNDNGSIFVFNGTQNIFNASIGSAYHQVISVAINEQYVAAFCFNGSLSLFSTITGNKMVSPNYQDIGLDSLFLQLHELFISQTNGQFIAYNITTNSPVWSNNSLNINHVLEGEFTGDSKIDLIALTNLGTLLTINPTNGSLEHSSTISNSQITVVRKTSLNNDSIADLIIGTRTGELFLYIGLDLTPPTIIQGTLTHLETDSSITLTFDTNKPAIATITYYQIGKSELSISNKSLLTNHSIQITNLKANTNYTLQISIADKFNNVNNNTLLIIQTKTAPPPYFMYVLSAGIVILGVVGSSYYVTKRRSQKKAFMEGERYYEAGEYILAIKSYIKANKKDKIIDIVTFLVSNPQLYGSFVDEIKQMEELSAYMVDIQEIIQSQQI